MNALDESRNLNTSNFGDSYVARKLDQIDNEIDETRSVVAHL